MMQRLTIEMEMESEQEVQLTEGAVEDVIDIIDIAFEEFQKLVIEHYDVLFQLGQIMWPSCFGKNNSIILHYIQRVIEQRNQRLNQYTIKMIFQTSI
jgi:hypothetical protein